MFGGHPQPDTIPLVLSPTDSEGDQVQDLFDDSNCDSLAAQYQPKQSTLHTFNQVSHFTLFALLLTLLFIE